MKNTALRYLLLLTFAVISNIGLAQLCNHYHEEKKACPPSTDLFQINGQSRSALMYKGQKSTVNVIFHNGQDYRITICPEEVLGQEIEFIMKDGQTQDILYNNADEDGKLIVEFSCEQTQRMTLEVKIPDEGEGTSNKLNKLKSTTSGCLGVLIEYMSTPRTGF